MNTAVKATLPLSKREREVLLWVSEGKTAGEIAAILNVSPRTVHKHLENIYSKLGVEMSIAATPARGDCSTAGTMVRAVSSDSLRGGAALHALSIAAIATLNTTCLLNFMTLTSSMHSDDIAQRCVGVARSVS